MINLEPSKRLPQDDIASFRFKNSDFVPTALIENIVEIAVGTALARTGVFSLIESGKWSHHCTIGEHVADLSIVDSLLPGTILNGPAIFVEDKPDPNIQDANFYYIGIPIVCFGETIAVLSLTTQNARSRSEDRVAVLKKLADHIGLLMEKEKNERWKLLEHAFRYAATPIHIVQKDSSLYDFNDAAHALLGYTRNEYAKLRIADLDPFYGNDVWPLHWEDLKKKQSLRFDSVMMRKDGKWIDVRIEANFIRYSDKELNITFLTDISGKKALEEKARLHSFSFNHISTGIIYLRKDGTIHSFNDAFPRIFGFDKEEFSKFTIFDFDSKFTRESFAAYWEKVKRNEVARFVGERCAKDGQALTLEITPNHICFEDLELICSIVMDITQQKKIEDRLQIVDYAFMNSAVPMHFMRRDGSVFDCNLAACTFMGYEYEAYKQLTVFDFNKKLSNEGFAELWDLPSRNKMAHPSIEVEITTRSGCKKDVEVHFNTLQYGKIELLCSTYLDITEKKKSEERLKLADFTFKNAATPILMLLPDSSFYDCNHAMAELLGYEQVELSMLTTPDIDVTHQKEACEAGWELFRQQKKITFLSKLKKKDGTLVDVELRNNLISYFGQEINFCFVLDITEKKKTEERLRLVDFSFRNGSNPQHFLNKDGSIHAVNEAACELLGYTEAEYMELSIESISQRHDKTSWAKRFLELKQGQKVLSITKLIKKDGSVFDAEVRSDVLEFEGIERVYVTITDVTEKLRQEEALKKSNQRYENATLATSDVVWEWDLASNLTYYSPNFTKLFGHPVKEETSIEDSIWRKNVHPEDLPMVLSMDNHIATGSEEEWEYEYRLKKADGEYACILDRGFSIKDGNNKVVSLVGAMQDITEKKEKEKQSNLMESAVLNTNDAILIAENRTAPQTNLITVFANKAFESMTGHGMEEIIGKDLLEYLNIAEQPTEETWTVKEATLQEAPFESTLPIACKNGQNRWAYIRASPIKANKGEIPHWVFICSDVTERKEAALEKEKLLKELVANNKELIQFSYIVSHNLRAPLTNLVSITNMIKPEKISDPLTARLIQGFTTTTNLLNETLNDLIKIMVIKENKNWETDTVVFKEVFDKIKTSIEIKLQDSHATVIEHFEEAPSVKFRKEYMESILLNLTTNSLRYADPQRNPVIQIKTTIAPSGNVALTYSDNGLGMDMEKVKHKIFGLYQRFHSNPDSKGLGLYLVHSQVTALGGTISVESEIGVGTKFTIVFK